MSSPLSHPLGRPHPLCCRPGRIFGNQPGFIVSCIGARAFVLNDEAAFVVGTERMPGGEMACTNVFCVEDGVWRIANHMGGQGRGLKSTEEDAEKLGLDLQRLASAMRRRKGDGDDDEDDDDVVTAPLETAGGWGELAAAARL